MDLKSPASASAPAASVSVAMPAASQPVAAPASGAASTTASGLPLIRASDAESPYGSLVSTVFTVALVGAAVIWALRRSGWAQRRATQPSARMLQVRETVHVAPKVRVTYLRCGEHELLLAHSEHSQAWITLPPGGGAPPSTSVSAPASAFTPPPTPGPQGPSHAA